jgi:hypothetical protein
MREYVGHPLPPIFFCSSSSAVSLLSLFAHEIESSSMSSFFFSIPFLLHCHVLILHPTHDLGYDPF